MAQKNGISMLDKITWIELLNSFTNDYN